MSGMTSTGRGGAGNITEATKSQSITPADLETPTLKTSVVTTGRGGSGNMALNLDPVETRARQDVGPVERAPSTGAVHVGRGGAANVARSTSSGSQSDAQEVETAPSDAATTPATAQDADKIPQPGKTDAGNDQEKSRGLAQKAKDFFKLT